MRHSTREKNLYEDPFDGAGRKVTLVSVVLPVHNAETTVGEAVRDLLTQTYRRIEVIAVDDGSTDASAAVLEAVDDPRVRLVRTPRNLGVAGALQFGIEKTTGDLIARMDADDRTDPARIALQVDEFQRRPSLGLLGTAAFVVDADTGASHSYRPPAEDSVLQRELLHWNWFVHGSTMFRAQCVETVGGYRDEFNLAEDYDLWLRIAEVWQVAHLRDILYTYHRHSASVSLSRLEEVQRAEERAREAAIARRSGSSDSGGAVLDAAAASAVLGRRGLLRHQVQWVRTLAGARRWSDAGKVALMGSRTAGAGPRATRNA